MGFAIAQPILRPEKIGARHDNAVLGSSRRIVIAAVAHVPGIDIIIGLVVWLIARIIITNEAARG
jgi:hypothetical protein